MWSHYADNHKGFCIEYDVKTILYSDFRSRFLFPVIYSEQVYDATQHLSKSLNHKSFNSLHLNMAGLIKAVDWSYEKEPKLQHIDSGTNVPPGKA